MPDLILDSYGDQPPSYLVQDVPGLMLAKTGLGDDANWVFLAVGAPLFQPGQEQEAQQLMRRYGLDQQCFQTYYHAAVALHQALEKEQASE